MERRGFVAPCPPVCTAATEKKDPVVAGIVNDSGLPKKGMHSAGVAQQYYGQTDKQIIAELLSVCLDLSVSRRN
jgi:SRSO17 transposase